MVPYAEIQIYETPLPPLRRTITPKQSNIDVFHFILVFMIAILFLTV